MNRTLYPRVDPALSWEILLLYIVHEGAKVDNSLNVETNSMVFRLDFKSETTVISLHHPCRITPQMCYHMLGRRLICKRALIQAIICWLSGRLKAAITELEQSPGAETRILSGDRAQSGLLVQDQWFCLC